MRARNIVAFLVAFVCLSLVQRGLCVQEKPAYKTPEELRKASEPFMRTYSGYSGESRPDPDARRLFIVDYLDSKNQEMRDTAADILADLIRFRRRIRASAFKKYLSDEYPVNVRVISLAYSMNGFVPYNKKSENLTQDQERLVIKEKMNIWSEVFNEIAESEETPADVEVIALTMPMGIGYYTEEGKIVIHSPAELLRPENQPIMLRWFLSGLTGESAKDQKRIMHIIGEFPSEIVVEAEKDWYVIEDDRDVRAMFINKIGNISRIEYLEKYKPVLQLAAKDEDEEIAKKAKALLEKMKE